MKLIIKAIGALLLITVPVILESCCYGCGPCGAKDAPTAYDFNGMTMTLMSRTNYVELPPGTTSLSEINFQVDIDATYTSFIESRSVGTAAYACSPAPIRANQQITSIVITSDNDLIASPTTIFSGEDLSVLFTVETEESQDPTSEILNKPFYGRRLSFFSDADLDSQQTHTFTFKITLSNGVVYEMVTRELSLIAG